MRCDNKSIVFRRTGIAGQYVEQGGGIDAIRLFTGKDADIRIDLCSGIVVVSGAHAGDRNFDRLLFECSLLASRIRSALAG